MSLKLFCKILWRYYMISFNLIYSQKQQHCQEWGKMKAWRIWNVLIIMSMFLLKYAQTKRLNLIKCIMSEWFAWFLRYVVSYIPHNFLCGKREHQFPDLGLFWIKPYVHDSSNSRRNPIRLINSKYIKHEKYNAKKIKTWNFPLVYDKLKCNWAVAFTAHWHFIGDGHRKPFTILLYKYTWSTFFFT